MKRILVAIAVGILLAILAITPALAVGLGFTGNFYRQQFELAQGQTSEGTEAYIYAINTSSEPELVSWKATVPEGIAIALPEPRILEAGETWKVDIIVEVGYTAAAGDYRISVQAVATPPNETGILIGAGGMQTADLRVIMAHLPGDANSDGEINIVDAMFIAQSTVGLREVPEWSDFNGDGKTTVVDAMLIARSIVEEG